MGIKYGRCWGGARISLSREYVLSREYFPSSLIMCYKLVFSLFFSLALLWHHENTSLNCLRSAVTLMLEKHFSQRVINA